MPNPCPFCDSNEGVLDMGFITVCKSCNKIIKGVN